VYDWREVALYIIREREGALYMIKGRVKYTRSEEGEVYMIRGG
jgi:hypothetical protein